MENKKQEPSKPPSPKPDVRKWATPTFERIALKEAFSGGGAYIPYDNTTYSS